MMTLSELRGAPIGSGGYGHSPDVPARPMGPFGLTSSALSQANLLADRVEDLRSRLLGSRPTAGEAKPQPCPDGLFPSVREQASACFNRTSEALAAIAEIERELP